jgi:hypothetical protein
METETPSGRLRRRRQTKVSVPGGPAAGRTAANAVPPIRPATSVSRRTPARKDAKARSSRSLSARSAERSRSRRTTATLPRKRRAVQFPPRSGHGWRAGRGARSTYRDRCRVRPPCETLDVSDEAPIDGRPRHELVVTLEDADEDEELADDLGGPEPDAPALPCEARRRHNRIPVLLERRDEGRQRPEKRRPAEALQGGRDARAERLFDALDGEIPARQPHDPVHAGQRREGVG